MNSYTKRKPTLASLKSRRGEAPRGKAANASALRKPGRPLPRPTGVLGSAFKLLTIIARHKFMLRGFRVYVCADFAKKRLVCLSQDGQYFHVAGIADAVMREAMDNLHEIDNVNYQIIKQSNYEIEYPRVEKEDPPRGCIPHP